MKRKLMGSTLVVIGIIILCVINYGRFKAETIQQQMKKSILENTVINDKENEKLNINELNINELNILNQEEKDDKTNKISEESVDNTEKPEEEKIENTYKNCIGILSIPIIDLEVAISNEVTMNNLKYSVSHYLDTAGLGEKGNCCIAGHRSYSYNEFFNRLNEVNTDDYIYVENAKNKFTYKVYDIFIVEPTEVGVLDPSENHEITLITCTPIRTATYRLIIKGKLVESVEKD